MRKSKPPRKLAPQELFDYAVRYLAARAASSAELAAKLRAKAANPSDADATVIGGDSSNVVNMGEGNDTVLLFGGSNNVTVGGGTDNIVVLGGSSKIDIAGADHSHDAVFVPEPLEVPEKALSANPNDVVLINGSNDTVVASTNNESIYFNYYKHTFRRV